MQRTNCSGHALHSRKSILMIVFAPCRFGRLLPTIHGRRISLRRQRPTSLCSHPFIHGACYRRLSTDAFHCGDNAIVPWNLNPTMLLISAMSNYTPFIASYSPNVAARDVSKTRQHSTPLYEMLLYSSTSTIFEIQIVFNWHWTSLPSSRPYSLFKTSHPSRVLHTHPYRYILLTMLRFTHAVCCLGLCLIFRSLLHLICWVIRVCSYPLLSNASPRHTQ